MTVIDDAIRIIDARQNTAERVLKAIAEVDLPQHLREALLERLEAAGVI